MDAQKQTSTSFQRYMYMTLAVLLTSSSNLLLKLQDKQKTDINLPYTHPIFQCTLMYLGQFLCLLLDCCTSQSKIQEFDNLGNLKKPPPMYVFVLPAFLDSIGLICFTYGLVFCTLSLTQIIGSLLIVSSAIFSYLILHKTLRSFHLISILLIIMGVALSIVASQVFNKDDDSNSSSIWGILMLIFANIIWSLQYITEEKFFSVYQVSSMRALGLEGLMGLIYFAILLAAFQFIPCSFVKIGNQANNGLCVYGKIEDLSRAIMQNKDSLTLLLSSIGYIIVTTFSNVCMIAVIKYGMAFHSCIVSNLRTVVIWGISLIFQWEKFNWLEFIGYLIFVAVGSFVYHEMVNLPIFGNKDYDDLSKSQKELLEDEKK